MSHDFDLLCMGRAAVDLYGEQLGSPLEDVRSFSRSVGGCPANVAVGASRQGLSVAILTRVGNEQMGVFVREELRREGVDVSQVQTDPDRLTGLVLLSILGPDRFPLIFFRERCADMGLTAQDVDPAFVARCKALMVTGTHLSTESTRAATQAAIHAAKTAGTKVILDIDYRPVLWGLTAHGEGEERFVASQGVTEVMQSIVADCDLIVGTEEELRIAGGAAVVQDALRNLRAISDAPIVVKLGPRGCAVYEGSMAKGQTYSGVKVDVLNVLGAGDAFLAGFLRGWLAEGSAAAGARYGNACGALVVSRHACAPAMPTRLELDDYLRRESEVVRIDKDPRIARLHECTTRRPRPARLAIFAFDHRVWFEEVVAQTAASSERLQLLKTLFVEAAEGVAAAVPAEVASCGVIVDGRYGSRALAQTSTSPQLSFVARPVEAPGTDSLQFWPEHLPRAARALETELRKWPVDRVVKCLINHPCDQPERQTQALLRLQRVCSAQAHDLMLEVLPALGGLDTLPTALAELYDQGLRPRWWKLPAPSAEVFDRIAEVIATRDPYCDGVLILGADTPASRLLPKLQELVAHPMCRGFALGRTLFGGPAERWLKGELDDQQLEAEVAQRFKDTIETVFEAQS